jgi:hypothetical protein
MEDILREYELRLLDAADKTILVVPLIAVSEDGARTQAAALMEREKAAGFLLTPQMSSRNYRGQKPAAPTG